MRRKVRQQVKVIKKPVPNIFGRAFTMLFSGLVLVVLLLGSSVRFEYNPQRVKDETTGFIGHVQKVVSFVKAVRPLF
jgi:hypothetical protein